MTSINTLETKFFPFYRLGLRRNPFGSLTDEEWLAVTILPPALAALHPNNCRYVQLMGEPGRGKTTLLLRWGYEYLRRGEHIAFEKLPEGQRHFTTRLNELDGFALDEAQRLSWLERRRLFRAIGEKRLFISTHEDMTRWFRRYGFNVTTFDAAEFMTCDHLAALLARRLVYFAGAAGPGVAFAADAVDYLWHRFGTDLRAVEQLLYEFFQQLREPGVITTSALRDFLQPDLTARYVPKIIR